MAAKKKDDIQDSAYYRRNCQTTYGWYGSPGSNSLGRSGRSSRRTCDRFNERKLPRPESSNYIYEGGLFSTPSSPRRDYFVIHPEWVSEGATHIRLSRDKKNRTGTWPGRRCRSAPPPSYRNPITWEPN
uniref:Uncharacterized protein n=1 Tax=Octopus bimaculoides TaxID=37653 RepID=A0A0L8H4Z9_OCTBM